MTKDETWRSRFKKLKVKRMKNHHWIRVSHLRGFFQSELAKAKEEGRREMLEELDDVKKILEYIASRNESHSAACIPRAKEALELLKSKLKP